MTKHWCKSFCEKHKMLYEVGVGFEPTPINIW